MLWYSKKNGKIKMKKKKQNKSKSLAIRVYTKESLLLSVNIPSKLVDAKLLDKIFKSVKKEFLTRKDEELSK